MADVINSQTKNSEAPESASASGYNVIGKPRPRHDAWSKVLGNTVYAADYLVPDMLFAKVLTSPYPNARIKTTKEPPCRTSKTRNNTLRRRQRPVSS